MTPASRRGVLGGLAALSAPILPALAAPLLPAIASPAPVSRVEVMFREAQALYAKALAMEDAWAADPRPPQQKRAASTALEEVEATRNRLLDAAMLTPPETVTDALLVIAATAYEARITSESDLTECGAERFRAIARAGRRAADFLAAHLGCGLAGALGDGFDMGSVEA